MSCSLTRQMCWRMLGGSHPMEAHIAESRALVARGQQADVREGVTSFFEKRPAVYPDRVPENLPDIWSDWVEPQYR